LLTRTNRQLGAIFCQRSGNGLPDLSVAAHPGYDSNFAFKTGRHVIQSDVCSTQMIDVSSIRLATPSLLIHPIKAVLI
jgi:hypothetical protein